MSSPILFGLYLARVRFVESGTFKMRPVIVVSQAFGIYGVVTIVPVFSDAHSESVDVALRSWQAIGLSRPSVARVHRLTAMAQVDLLEKLGNLPAEDIKMIKQALKHHLEL